MPRRMRRAAVLGTTAKVASTRGQAKGAAAAEQAPPVTAAPAAEPADAATAVPSSAAAADNYDTLMKLKGLVDAGVLSQDEFDAEKRKILGA